MARKVEESFCLGIMISKTHIVQKALWGMNPAIAELPLTLFQEGADLLNPPPNIHSIYKAQIKHFPLGNSRHLYQISSSLKEKHLYQIYAT